MSRILPAATTVQALAFVKRSRGMLINRARPERRRAFVSAVCGECEAGNTRWRFGAASSAIARASVVIDPRRLRRWSWSTPVKANQLHRLETMLKLQSRLLSQVLGEAITGLPPPTRPSPCPVAMLVGRRPRRVNSEDVLGVDRWLQERMFASSSPCRAGRPPAPISAGAPILVTASSTKAATSRGGISMKVESAQPSPGEAPRCHQAG